MDQFTVSIFMHALTDMGKYSGWGTIICTHRNF